MRYLSPKAELTFKKVFGEHKDVIISFLNALLPLEGDDEQITWVEYLTPELVPQELIEVPEISKAVSQLEESAFSKESAPRLREVLGHREHGQDHY